MQRMRRARRSRKFLRGVRARDAGSHDLAHCGACDDRRPGTPALLRSRGKACFSTSRGSNRPHHGEPAGCGSTLSRCLATCSGRSERSALFKPLLGAEGPDRCLCVSAGEPFLVPPAHSHPARRARARPFACLRRRGLRAARVFAIPQAGSSRHSHPRIFHRAQRGSILVILDNPGSLGLPIRET